MAPPEPTVLQFVFDNFESLSHQPGKKTCSDTKDDGDGNSWQLQLYPGGKNEEDNEYLSMFLRLPKGKHAVNAAVSFTMRDSTGGACKHSLMPRHHFGVGGSGWGWKKWAMRSDILNANDGILSDGALVIDVVIQIIKEKVDFEPTNPALQNMRELCECNLYSNIKFKVDNEIIPAHKLVLQMNAPILAEFCGNKKHPVAIKGTTPDVFRIVLQYVYGGDVPSDGIILAQGKDIIEAANRYDIVGLKLAVEGSLVKQRIMDVKNVAEWLVFADSKTCPMLKEYALSYFTCRVKDVLAHKSSANLKESPELLQEAMLAMSSHFTKDHFTEADKMSVGELRAKLDSMGLDVDGSKETLVSRLSGLEQSDGEEDMTMTSWGDY
ncbi:hypothetical protein ACHAXT_010921 [Thalassiosira profunda]